MVSKASLPVLAFWIFILVGALDLCRFDLNFWALYLLNNTDMWLPFLGGRIPLGIPLVFYVIALPFLAIFINLMLVPRKIEKGEAYLGKALVLDRKNHIFKELRFKKGAEEIEHKGEKYKIDSEKFVFLREYPISSFFIPRRTPYLYYDSEEGDPLDIESVRKAQKFKKFNPVQMRLVVQENLTSGFFKSLVLASGRKVLKVRYILVVFLGIAALLVVLNYYFPDLFKGVLGG